MLLNAHFNIIIFSKEEDIQRSINYIDSSLFTQGIIPSGNAYNQFELFRTAFPGNGVELKEYDWFLTTSDAALTFFLREACLLTNPFPIGFQSRLPIDRGVRLRF